MKNFLKLLLPLGAFVLASAAAVKTSDSVDNSSSTAIEGWERIGVNDCVSPVQCNNIPAITCKTGIYDAMGKVGLDCVQPLFHTP